MRDVNVRLRRLSAALKSHPLQFILHLSIPAQDSVSNVAKVMLLSRYHRGFKVSFAFLFVLKLLAS